MLIRASIGRVLDVDTAKNGIGCWKFLRVKIELSLTKPLAWGWFVNFFWQEVMGAISV